MGTYRRQSISQRGHFSNLPTLFPIAELSIEAKGIKIKQRFRNVVFLEWGTVGVEILSRKTFKSYGKSSGGNFTQKICTLNSGNKRYAFDVSASFPDFSQDDTQKILDELSIYCEIKNIIHRTRNWKGWWTNFDWR